MKQFLNKEEEQEKLQQFIFEIDDLLEEFIDDTESLGYILDYTINSLDTLERFILDKEIVNTDNDLDIRTKCWIYLGELFRKLIKKGEWSVSLNDENTINYGLYTISNYNNEKTEFVPIRYVKAFILKKEKGFFRSVIKNHINPELLNLDDIPTED